MSHHNLDQHFVAPYMVKHTSKKN